MRSEEDKRASGGALRRLIRNGLSAWGAMVLSGVTSVFITPFLIGRMGLEGYGWTVLLLLVTSLPSIVDFGFRAALQ
jgi:hypothetical protein